jgi:putative hemolysin
MTGIWLILVALFFSAYFSGSEISFTSLNPIQVQIWLKQRRKGSRLTDYYLNQPDKFLITTLIGNNLANIAYTSLATIWFLQYGWSEWLNFLIISLFILFFGEIIPKLVFYESTNFVFPGIAFITRIFHWAFYPFVWAMSTVTGRLISSADDDSANGVHRLRAHLRVYFNEAESAGQLDESESRMLEKTLELSEIIVGELMTPRMEIKCLPVDAKIKDLTQIVSLFGYSKIPVYRDNIDNIIGYLAIKDLFFKPVKLSKMIRTIPFLPDIKPASELLAEFISNNWNIAVILDEYGGTAGIITLEDILEHLVGDIDDEHDPQQNNLVRLADGRLFINSRSRISTFFEKVGLPEPPGDWDTVGGWVITSLGRIPEQGELIQIDNLRFKIITASASHLSTLILESTGPGS